MILSGCASGPADYNDKPNGLQRADVVSKNAKSITVEHSTEGEKSHFVLLLNIVRHLEEYQLIMIIYARCVLMLFQHGDVSEI